MRARGGSGSARRSCLADECGNDIVFGVPQTVLWGPLSEGHDPVSQEPHAVSAIDCIGIDPDALLCDAEVDARNPVEDCSQSPNEAHPREEP